MNDRDWFRKGMKNRRPGCVMGLVMSVFMSGKYVLFAAVAGISVLLDQLTKWWVVQYVGRADEIEVIPGFLSVVHAKNPGAAFSALDEFEYRMYVFAAFTVVAVGVLLHTLRELREDERAQTVAVGLLMGGAIGNGIDRVLYQEVTDFLRVYTEWSVIADPLRDWFGTSTWPIFNVADAAIVVGVIAFTVYFLFLEEREAPEDVELPQEA